MTLHRTLQTLAALSFLTLGACTHYRYVDPDTEQGKQCVAKLDAQVSACEERAKNLAEGQRVLDDAQRNSYQSCTHQFNPTPQNPEPCSSLKPSVSNTVNTNACRSGYAERFIACGGRLEEIKDE